ncbi:MAG: hypothetical protein H0V19_07515, partial [Euzebyales bacterium]|nr:hypothetical protein [Euzebyales bacterium]
AWALHRAGDSEQALPHVAEALRLGSADALLRFHAASVYAGAGRPERARTQLRTAFELNPWFSFRHRARARRLAERLDVVTPAVWSRG